ncbi:hypothetical protein [Sphingobium chungbukense]|uniref:Uncharacterized protein n=1 Tax=Sphingobium chungbukense TaxID=56193 RepID=A0A0M3AQZ8_9SPHN|nr:hypothetical protein [Sphingobium chungbukense]KKW92637.1 hypothetical protein YP76_06790 [Sphingobium chungbukense]
MSGEELKRCPMCNGEMMLRHALWPSDGDTDAIIHREPTTCGLKFFSIDTADNGVSVAAAWNRRSSPPQNDAGVVYAKDRDKIAALIDPGIFKRELPKRHDDARRAQAYRKADEIIAALRAPELQAWGQEFEAGESRQGMSACNKCGKQYPSAPLGYHHKCGLCSGICHPLPSAPSGEIEK